MTCPVCGTHAADWDVLERGDVVIRDYICPHCEISFRTSERIDSVGDAHTEIKDQRRS